MVADISNRYLSEISSEHLEDFLDIAFDAYERSEHTDRDQLDFAHLCNTKGVLHLDRGQHALAVRYLEQCKAVREECLLPEYPNHEELANILNNLGNAAYSQERFPAALEYQQRAMIIRLKQDSTVSLGMSHLNMGRALWKLDQRGSARTSVLEGAKFSRLHDNWYMLAQ